MRTLLTLVLLLAGTVAHAQDAAPAPREEPSEPTATLAPDAREDPRAPVVVEDGDAERAAGSTRGPCWSPLAAGVLPCLGADALGGALLGLGCLFLNVSPEAGDDSCAAACVSAVVSAGFVVLGVVFGVAALVVLGPLAAVAVTIAASVGSAIAGRAFWGAALGGVPGVLLGIGGLALAGVGLANLDIGSNGLEPALFSGDPSSTLVLAGVGMAASAGLVSLLGAFLGDVAFTALLSEEEPPAPREVSRPAPRELPLALGDIAPRRVAY